MNNVYHFDVELHVNVVAKAQGEFPAPGEFPPESLHAEVHAPTEHLARRKIMDDLLDRRLFVKRILKSEAVG